MATNPTNGRRMAIRLRGTPGTTPLRATSEAGWNRDAAATSTGLGIRIRPDDGRVYRYRANQAVTSLQAASEACSL